MEGSNKSSILIFSILIIGLLVLLVGTGIFAVNILTKGQATVLSTNVKAESSSPNNLVIQEPNKHITTQKIDYAFTNEPLPNVNDDNLVTAEIKNNLDGVQSVQTNLVRLTISKLKINGPIVQGVDGTKALDQGFWLYPLSSNNIQGEKIFLCHRRHWGEYHPNSCWHLDSLQNGDSVQITDATGKIYNYSVIAVATQPQEDKNIYNISNDDLVKIITCAPLGNSTHRLIVIAKRVS